MQLVIRYISKWSELCLNMMKVSFDNKSWKKIIGKYNGEPTQSAWIDLA